MKKKSVFLSHHHDEDKYAAELVRLYFSCKRSGFSTATLDSLSGLIESLPCQILKLELGHGLHCLFDQSDFHLIKQHIWCLQKTKTEGLFYAKSGRLLMHRFLLGNGKNLPTEQTVDHKNRNGLDNCRKNIWIVQDWSWQMAFRKGWAKKSGSSFVGVFKSGRGWGARLQGKHLGTFDTEEQAAQAYLARARLAWPMIRRE